MEFRSGVTMDQASQESPGTPDEWSLKKDDTELKPWQKDAQSRGKMKPFSKKSGDKGEGFKRVSAGDII